MSQIKGHVLRSRLSRGAKRVGEVQIDLFLVLWVFSTRLQGIEGV